MSLICGHVGYLVACCGAADFVESAKRAVQFAFVEPSFRFDLKSADEFVYPKMIFRDIVIIPDHNVRDLMRDPHCTQRRHMTAGHP
jgi:hypothetical protein